MSESKCPVCLSESVKVNGRCVVCDAVVGQQKVEDAAKFDHGKLRYDLLPVDALESIVDVYTMGAAKYGDRNWEKGMSFSRVFGAICRHLFQFWKGEDLDTESGLPHLSHAAWGCFTLLAYWKRDIGKDDRVKL